MTTRTIMENFNDDCLKNTIIPFLIPFSNEEEMNLLKEKNSK